MEQDTFGRLSRRLARGLNRRTLAGIAGVGVASSLVMPRNVSGKKKKKKKCPPAPLQCPTCSGCEVCVNGACQPVADGAVCGQGKCTICVSGTCQAVTNGNTCDVNGCKTCRDGACETAENGTACSRGTCQAGACRCRFLSSDCGQDCFCDASYPTGDHACWSAAGNPCTVAANCTADADCGAGEGCLQQDCFETGPYGVCWPRCGV